MNAEITPDDVKDLLDTDADIRIVDIRNEAAFQQAHLPNSESIPFPELPTRVSSLDGADHIVTVCPHGKSSVQAARLIKSYEGIADDARVESMTGGLEAWEYELESSTKETTDETQQPF